MSGRLVGEILEHAPADLTPAQMLVLVSIAETAHDRDRIARHVDVTLESLTRRTRLKVGSVKNALRELRDRGLIRTLHVAHRGKAQAYEIARLEKQHRFATVRSLPAPRTPHLRAVGDGS